MDLLAKYNVPGPRYTSYPTVPYWDNPPNEEQWKALVKEAFHAYNDKEGLSIYIHLPYCESLCTFCGCTTRITVNHEVEEPYIQALLAEWDLYLKLFGSRPNIREIHLGGGTPTFFSPANLSRLIHGLTGRATVSADAQFGFEASPRSTTRQHLITLSELGFTRISLGIQDFDEKVQKTINRVQSFEQVREVTDWAREQGFTSINYDLVYGLPFQTVDSIEYTIDLVNLLRPDRIAFYSYAHVPWIKPGQRSFTEKDLPEGAEKHNLYVRGKNMLRDAGYLEIGMDHFALPQEELAIAFRQNRLHRNFMGYTTAPSKLLVGLGVSSISDTWTGFGQNVKVVEEYLKRVNEGHFPIFRGHVLNEEDLLIRQLILDLMCRFKARIKVAENTEDENLRLLREMEADKLVQIQKDQLKVTKIGRSYIRNICMVFDERLRRKQPDRQVFSMTV